MHPIIGREVEQREMAGFVYENFKMKQSGLLYLCGHPGTGKTTVLNHTIETCYEKRMPVKVFEFNAMSFEDFPQFLEKLDQELVKLIESYQNKRQVKPKNTTA